MASYEVARVKLKNAQLNFMQSLQEKNNTKKDYKIVFSAKTKLNTIEVLISKALINLCLNHDKFVSVNNVLREYNEMREDIKNPPSGVYSIKTMETYCVSCKNITPNENSCVRKTKQNKLTLLSNCAICSNKKSGFIKNEELL